MYKNLIERLQYASTNPYSAYRDDLIKLAEESIDTIKCL